MVDDTHFWSAFVLGAVVAFLAGYVAHGDVVTAGYGASIGGLACSLVYLTIDG